MNCVIVCVRCGNPAEGSSSLLLNLRFVMQCCLPMVIPRRATTGSGSDFWGPKQDRNRIVFYGPLIVHCMSVDRRRLAVYNNEEIN
jgi:hypothetical protein